MTRVVAALFATVTLAVVPAAAQDVGMALNPTTMIGYAGTVAADQHARQTFNMPLNRVRPVPPARAASVVAQLAYRPSDAVRQQVYGRAVAKIQKANAQDAAKLRSALESGQIRRQAAGYLGRYGMSPNNVVDTTALYLASAWLASRADAGDPTPAQMSGLRAQVAAAMVATPGMVRANDAIKQEIAEANIIQALFAGTLASAAAQDPKFASTARNAVTRGVMATYKIDLTQVQLTNQGLR